MPDDLEDLAQQVRLLRGVVDSGTGGVVAASSNVVAQVSAPGVVVPTTSSKLWTLTTAGAVGGVQLTMGTAPLTGRSCIVDVKLNDVSLWANPADRPTFTSSQTNPLVTTLASPADYLPGDVLTAFVIDGGSGRNLEVLVTEA